MPNQEDKSNTTNKMNQTDQTVAFNQPPLQEEKAPWRNTPLDNWSTEIDPAIMSGDQWVDNKNDPGSERRENQDIAEGKTNLLEPFMHPVHDVEYRNAED